MLSSFCIKSVGKTTIAGAIVDFSDIYNNKEESSPKEQDENVLDEKSNEHDEYDAGGIIEEDDILDFEQVYGSGDDNLKSHNNLVDVGIAEKKSSARGYIDITISIVTVVGLSVTFLNLKALKEKTKE